MLIPLFPGLMILNVPSSLPVSTNAAAKPGVNVIKLFLFATQEEINYTRMSFPVLLILWVRPEAFPMGHLKGIPLGQALSLIIYIEIGLKSVSWKTL